ncbi:unnamed protein product [Chondrus crispus]|uniref:Reverse transcriptase Ty1/copia-type domain-containing protein n=1 Tax=Chondrus crispus TaxID=2769 RepID=R7Q485_CHOCR|nr:unnamed protein product [Chondrus crispus]CDF32156.1 unnamed protein product [Chondrus crispus]|eukprot:XP_005711821.1 unnamed protein product [Chondrus crispus]
MQDAAPHPTPYADGATVDPPRPAETPDNTISERYRKALGEIRYIADCTRPDISYATAALARATHCPTQRHWNFLKRTVRYLLGTSTHGILLPRNPTAPALISYADADFANDTVSRKSISGAVSQVYGGTVHWLSKQQPLVAQSTCEAEYISAAETAQITVWIRNLLTELGYRQHQPTTLCMDNAAAITIARNTAPTKRRKCIDIRYHLLQDLTHHHAITLKHVTSRRMYADIMTKPLKPMPFNEHRANLRVQPPCHQVQFDLTPTVIGPQTARQGDCDDPQIEDRRRAVHGHDTPTALMVL